MDNELNDDGVYWDADLELADEPDELPCPYCGSLENEYRGEVYDDDEYEGSGFKCLECGSNWSEHRWDELHG